jgi:hypothetical protein
MDMAESNPDMFGNSIHIFSECYESEVAGKNRVLHKLDKFKAVDLVDDPAATDALFSSNPNDLGVIITDFLDNNPKIFHVIQKNPEIIQDFFDRYTNYSNRKSLINYNMNIFDKLKKKLGAKKDDAFDIDLTLADGSIVTVITDAEEPQPGDAIVDDTGAPLADNQYVLPDGGAITVTGGVIEEITEAPEAPETPETTDPNPMLQEVKQSVNRLEKQFSNFLKKYESTQEDNEKAFDLLASNLNRMGKEIKSKFDVPSHLEKEPKKISSYDPEKAKEIRENNKKK